MATRATFQEAQELASNLTNGRVIERPYEKWTPTGFVNAVRYEVVEIIHCPQCNAEIQNIDYGCIPYPCGSCREASEAKWQKESAAKVKKAAADVARHEAFDKYDE
jgi:hypothetical protein